MNTELLKKAQAKIGSTPILVNLIAKRERELINGAKPLINPTTLLTDEDRAHSRTGLDVDKCDIALAEVVADKLIAEIDFDAIEKAEESKTKWSKKRVNVNALYGD